MQKKKHTTDKMQKLPDKEHVSRAVSLQLIKKAMKGVPWAIKEISKYLNLDPYVNDEFEAITKLPATEQHIELMKLYAKRKITEEQAFVYNKLLGEAMGVEILRKVNERLDTLEKNHRKKR